MALTQISTKGIKDGTITGADLATNVDLVDNQKIRFGTGNDLEIYHDGSNSYVSDQGTGVLNILGSQVFISSANNQENIAKFATNGSVDLYYDNSKKFETKSDGVLVTGELQATTLDINGNGHIDGTLQLTDDLFLGDNDEINVGSSNDLKIYHDGSNSYLKNAGTGNIIFLSDDVQFKSDGGGNTGLTIDTDAGVELYYNNSKKFETISSGVKLIGDASIGNICEGDFRFKEAGSGTTRVQWRSDEGDIKFTDTYKATFGTGNDLQIYHDGSNSYLIDSGTGNFYIGTNDFNVTNAAVTESFIKAVENGQVELYHDGNKKLETSSAGVKITDNFLGVNLDNPSGTPSSRNAFLGLGDSDTGVAQNGDGQLELWANNQEIMNIDTGEITAYKSLRPSSNNSVDLGGSSYRWATVYSHNALNTSDKNLKNTITDSDLGLSFINKLRPVSYKWNQKEEEVSDTKTHYGLIAQEIETALASEGKTLDNFAGVYKPDDYKEDGTGGAMAIAVSELISPLIKAIQELSAEVAALKAG